MFNYTKIQTSGWRRRETKSGQLRRSADMAKAIGALQQMSAFAVRADIDLTVAMSASDPKRSSERPV